MATEYTMVLADGREVPGIFQDTPESALYSTVALDPTWFANNVDGYYLKNDTENIYTIGAQFTGIQEIDGKYYIGLSFETQAEKAQRLNEEKIAILANNTLTDEQAADNPSLFPEWQPNGVYYAPGDKVNYQSALYKCLQGHESQPSWTPTAAASLWTAISDPNEEWPAWVQPTGAHDAYSQGDKVSHNGAHWVSDINANVWEPGNYGWTQQD